MRGDVLRCSWRDHRGFECRAGGFQHLDGVDVIAFVAPLQEGHWFTFGSLCARRCTDDVRVLPAVVRNAAGHGAQSRPQHPSMRCWSRAPSGTHGLRCRMLWWCWRHVAMKLRPIGLGARCRPSWSRCHGGCHGCWCWYRQVTSRRVAFHCRCSPNKQGTGRGNSVTVVGSACCLH